jgi:hypothetical protein
MPEIDLKEHVTWLERLDYALAWPGHHVEPVADPTGQLAVRAVEVFPVRGGRGHRQRKDVITVHGRLLADRASGGVRRGLSDG